MPEELTPLPEPGIIINAELRMVLGGHIKPQPFYSAGQMRAYALENRRAQPEPAAIADADYPCRSDGRCQYAIDHGAEGMGHCPRGKCAMADAAPSVAPEPPKPVAVSFSFIKRTNEEYRAWCRTYYSPDALESNGMVSLHGLWAWQEQERRKEAMQSAPSVAPEPVAHCWSVSVDGRFLFHSADLHDARLRLDGDFEWDDDRLAFAKEVIAKLNAAHPPRAPLTVPMPPQNKCCRDEAAWQDGWIAGWEAAHDISAEGAAK